MGEPTSPNKEQLLTERPYLKTFLQKASYGDELVWRIDLDRIRDGLFRTLEADEMLADATQLITYHRFTIKTFDLSRNSEYLAEKMMLLGYELGDSKLVDVFAEDIGSALIANGSMNEKGSLLAIKTMLAQSTYLAFLTREHRRSLYGRLPDDKDDGGYGPPQPDPILG